jgi:hypothetical protein
LLRQEAGEGAVPAGGPVIPLLLKSAAVLVKGLLVGCVLHISLFHLVLVRIIYFLPLDIELAQLVHIIDHMVAHLDTLSGLLQGILVLMDLGEDGAVLQFQLANDEHLSHSVGNAFLLKVEQAHWEVLKGMLDALGALFQHLHLLVAQGHIVKHHK